MKRDRAVRGSLRAVGLGVVLIVLITSGASATPATAPTHPTGGPLQAGPFASAWASYSGHGVTVVFPTTLPEVDLFDQTNISDGAALQVEAILELAPSTGAHPTVVAAALPAQLAGFTSTSSPNIADAPVTLAAALAVRNVGVALWTDHRVAASLGPQVGSATLDLSYTLGPATPSTSGLQVVWSVADWPWNSPHDLLALQMRLTLVNGISVGPCSAAPSGPSPGCSGALLDPVGIAWDASISSLVGQGPDGTSASLQWDPTAQVGSGGSVPYTVGTFSAGNASAELVLGVPADGSARLSGSLAFSLSTRPPPALPLVVHGQAAPYVATVVVSALVGLAGIALYQRRERRTREML